MRGLITRGLITGAALFAVVVSQRSVADDAAPNRGAAPPAQKAKETKSPATNLNERDQVRALAQAHRVGSQWVTEEASGRRIEFSIAPALQERALRLFSEYQLPHAAVVAIEPATGRVLAYASHAAEGPHGPDLAQDVTSPAASVFKLITSSALVDAGVGADTRVCYGGGSSRLDLVHLEDNPRREGVCTTLDEALGKSTNAVFAKLADRHLKPATLLRYARSFGFGHDLPFDFAPPASPIDVPSARLEFARTAAGFWHSYMSPLHGALIAATFANDGAMPEPWLVQRVTLPDGSARELSQKGSVRRVIDPATARSVSHMMLRTVRDGTSRHAFLDGRGRAQLPGISVAGKTGSLSTADPYRAYSWWVGFAPADHPRIALAALIINTPKWRIKSSFLARELLREYLLPHPNTAPELAQSKP
ncbi:MAG: hypothetical protein RL701_5678 [Pseudomonadota bacterium]